MPVRPGAPTKVEFELESLFSEMGKRGWELVCVLDTPYHVGISTSKFLRGLIVFFSETSVSSSYFCGTQGQRCQ